ncbi:hypothetical protein ACIBG8_04145 [Nonomuraea sp. NPDC050556]|uniref:hypothetical protein n=1 Tax=Nonomuraea sp. NPDC050556 TaxID=3364369 RepID=UPI0037A45727
MIRRILCLALLLVLAAASPAAAHNVIAGSDLRVAQTIAGTELTVVIQGTRRVPGPLRVSIVAYQPFAGPALQVEVRSLASGRAASGTVRPGGAVQLRVDRTGPHELTLRAGGEVALIPFRVLVERAAGWEFLIYGGLFLAGTLLIGGLLTGTLSRPSTGRYLVAGAAAAAAVAATIVVLEPQLPARQPDGAAPVEPVSGRPYAVGQVRTVPEQPVAGQEFTVRLDLVDGATGRAVDDLAVHHEALAHLVVTSQDGSSFRHVHPLRTAPGRLETRLRADGPGRYLVYAEFERQDSGGQMVSGAFDVTGRAVTVAAPRQHAPPRLTPAAPTAGRPVSIEVDPAGVVRPWLGMPGHLIVRSLDGGFLGHVHAMGSGVPLRFTFSFPVAGRYLAWAQYAVEDRIVTVPFTVDVS